jgi:hypothetical protein
MDIHRKLNIELVRYSSRKREEKGKLQEEGQGPERKDKIAGDHEGR